MSGKYSMVSTKVLRALEMGLGLSGNISSFKLAVVDSEGNPDTARKGVEDLLKKTMLLLLLAACLAKMRLR